MEATKERAARRNRATHARTSDSQPAHGSRPKSITHRRRRAKYQIRRLLAVLVLGVVGAALDIPQDPQTTADSGLFYGEVTDPTLTTYPEISAPPLRYELTDDERDTVERVVMAEAGGECYEGQMLVAQCILNASEKTGQRPPEAVKTFSYTRNRPEPTQSVEDAVAAVFDDGEAVTDELVLYFYNPALVRSDFHESQIFVIEVGGHRFFAERSLK